MLILNSKFKARPSIQWQTYPKIHSETNVETIIPTIEAAEPPVTTLSWACKALHNHLHTVGILKVPPPHTWSVPPPIHHWASHIHPPWPFESSNSLCLKHISHICFAPLIYHQISDTAPSSEVTAHFVPFVSTTGFIIILDNHLGFFPLSLDRKLYKYRDCTLFLVSAHCLAYSGHENSWRMIKNIYWEFFICRALSLCTLQQLSHFILITRYFTNVQTTTWKY